MLTLVARIKAISLQAGGNTVLVAQKGNGGHGGPPH